MIRLALLLLAGLSVVVAGSAWLGARPGEVSITWQGWLVEMSTGRFALAAAAAVVAAMIAAAAARAVWRVPRMVREGRRASRRDRGYRALTQGMVAVAAGDPGEALRLARRADALLDEPPLTMLLSAQAAQLNGEDEAARDYFREMLKRPEMAFLGLRGLLVQAERDGDRAAALEYARRAYELQAGSSWVLSTLFDLRVERGEWAEALVVLDEAARRRVDLPAAAGPARATVLLGCSMEAGAAGRHSRALRYARRAQALDPLFVPATLRVVELLVGGGRGGRAARVVREAWARTPHPELARAFGGLGGGGDALGRVRRQEGLLAANPDHDESHIALAEAALAAGLWGEARNHLGRVAGGSPPARVCRLMAELEEREHGDIEGARRWLVKASSAAPDPAWVCGDCGDARERWTPVCGGCGGLGTRGWRPPPHALAPGAAGAPGAGGGALAAGGPEPPADGPRPRGAEGAGGG